MSEFAAVEFFDGSLSIPKLLFALGIFGFATWSWIKSAIAAKTSAAKVGGTFSYVVVVVLLVLVFEVMGVWPLEN